MNSLRLMDLPATRNLADRWRKRAINRHLNVGCVLLLLTCIAGCGRLWGPTSQVGALRSKFLRNVEPTGAIPLREVRKGLSTQQQVVLVGRIGVPDQEPWIDGKAAFMVRDAVNEAAADHGGKSHDPASCPFCKRKASQPESTAFIQFLDERGELILIDARELFDLSEDQRVVVQGTARLLEPDILIVSAQTICVTRD